MKTVCIVSKKKRDLFAELNKCCIFAKQLILVNN